MAIKIRFQFQYPIFMRPHVVVILDGWKFGRIQNPNQQSISNSIIFAMMTPFVMSQCNFFENAYISAQEKLLISRLMISCTTLQLQMYLSMNILRLCRDKKNCITLNVLKYELTYLMLSLAAIVYSIHGNFPNQIVSLINDDVGQTVNIIDARYIEHDIELNKKAGTIKLKDIPFLAFTIEPSGLFSEILWEKIPRDI